MNSFLLRGGQIYLFVLLKPLTDWMRLTNVMMGKLFYSKPTNINVRFIQKHHHRNIWNNVWPSIWAPGPSHVDIKLTITPFFPLFLKQALSTCCSDFSSTPRDWVGNFNSQGKGALEASNKDNILTTFLSPYKWVLIWVEEHWVLLYMGTCSQIVRLRD